MIKRRTFLRNSLVTLGAIQLSPLASGCKQNAEQGTANNSITKPIVISTWDHGLAANAAAWEILSKSGTALDAVEAGVRVSEADPKVSSVGFGGLPDQTGIVSLDACIMDEKGNCGSVAFLQNILHPISVARRVMEKTPHVMLVGQGAYDFAVQQGFEKQELLTPEAEQAWKNWLISQGKPEPINRLNHDTIGMVAMDEAGNLSGACTTSGAAWKLHGRVGDSPIIGAGMYVDNEVGGAAATGWGEAVIKICGSFLVVEFMRQGHSPSKACEMAVDRLISKNPNYKEIQIGFIALNKQGETGAFCLQGGFDYAVYDKVNGSRLLKSESKL